MLVERLTWELSDANALLSMNSYRSLYGGMSSICLRLSFCHENMVSLSILISNKAVMNEK